MTEREARIAFNLIPAVGSVTVARLAEECGGSAADAYARFPDKRDWEGKTPDWEREVARAEKMHVTLVTELDAAYPPLLRTIASPPLVLYVVGDPSVLAKPGVALVGTRHCTDYGRETAERLAAGLAGMGWAIFSGLAAGIDAAAHRGALLGKGLTAGVLGGALDHFFPEENRALAREMVEAGGCVVSEFPFGRPPDAQTFPQRNRIVSGLSRGVVAVECPVKSGTMITCTRAAEQGRAVMAVPGRVDWKCASGCLHLIREGARLVRCADDIVEELSTLQELGQKNKKKAQARRARPPSVTQPDLPAAPLPRASGSPEETPMPRVSGSHEEAPMPRVSGSHEEVPMPRVSGSSEEMPKPKASGSHEEAPPAPPLEASLPRVSCTPEEAAILRAVPDEGAAIDAVVRAVGLPVSRVNVLLVGLRLKGRIKLLPGNRVAPSQVTR